MGDNVKTKETVVSSSMPSSSNLFALECLATTAGQLHESEKQKLDAKKFQGTPTIVENEDRTNKVPVVQMVPTSSEHNLVPSSIPSFPNFYPTLSQPPSVLRPFSDFTIPPPFSNGPFRNFMDIMPPISSDQYTKTEELPWNTTLIHSTTAATSETDDNVGDLHLSSEPTKSAFNVVPKRLSGISSPHSIPDVTKTSYEPIVSNSLNTSNNNIPQQPPMLFRIDQPNNNSLLETLVQESQKILSNQDEMNDNHQVTALKAMNAGNDKFFSEFHDNSRKETDQASKTNDDFKRAREMVLISPQKKSFKKNRTGLHSVNDVKRAYGGPPFKPGYAPPPMHTPESAMCCLYEHTLLKMATRGFWSGDRGPLQDVFRLTRVENSDLQYNMKEITKHCYNVVKRKLDYADGDKDMMQKHMRNYVDEFDSYLERIYPVSSIAINLYLPTAADYNVATWHGIVPTGWSEYRRAVVIREVFEVLFHLSCINDSLPEYNAQFFNKNDPDITLYPITINTIKKETTHEEDENSDQNNNDKKDDYAKMYSSLNIKYSRAFEALWTHTAPHEPFLILHDATMQMKLREYFEQYPIEVYAPSDQALIVVDDKKYKARNILGFFRRGVQLVDYSKDTGSMVIDTISTIRNVSATSAVRKIPPGRISKLVHPELHLENYTNAILQVGNNGVNGEQVISSKPTRIRRKRAKNRNHAEVKEEKVKRRRGKNALKERQQEQELQQQQKSNVIVANESNVIMSSPSNKKLESIESFCHSLNDVRKEDGENLNVNSIIDQLVGSTITHDTKGYNPSSPFMRENIASSSFSGRDKEEPSSINQSVNQRPSLIDQYTQTYDVLRPKPEVPNIFSPDILSPMYLPQPPLPPPTSANSPGQQIFSLHLMIDSYRRAAKYLLDTANHLELVARHGSHGNPLVNNNTNINQNNSDSPFTKREPREPPHSGGSHG